MGVAVMIGRFVLMILNTAFVIMGVALILVGVFIRYAGDQVLGFLNPVIQQFNSFSSISGVTATLDSSSTGFNIVDILRDNAVPFIAVGTILSAIAIFGCLGACWGLKILLLVYAILMCIIVGAQILAIVIIAAMYETLKADAIKYIKDTAKKEYRGTNATDIFSLLVNAVQMNLKCCGVTNYTDWHGTKWNQSDTFYAHELKRSDTGLPGPYVIPVACCIMNEPYPSFTPIDINCAKAPRENNSYIGQACFTFIEDKIKEYELYAILSAVALELVQIIIIVAACLVFKSLSEPNKVGS